MQSGIALLHPSSILHYFLLSAFLLCYLNRLFHIFFLPVGKAQYIPINAPHSFCICLFHYLLLLIFLPLYPTAAILFPNVPITSSLPFSFGRNWSCTPVYAALPALYNKIRKGQFCFVSADRRC